MPLTHGPAYRLPFQFAEQIRRTAQAIVSAKKAGEGTKPNGLRILVIDDAIASARTAETILAEIGRAVSKKAAVWMTEALVTSQLRLAGVSDTDILASVARIAKGLAQFVDRPVKEVEFEAFVEAAEELDSDQPDGDFFARALPKNAWDATWMSPIERVVLVHRLREVVAQVGFTRFVSLGTDINGELPDELTLNVQATPLARDADWLPAVENRGVGLFLLFDTTTIINWMQRPLIQSRAKLLASGFAAWKNTHPNSSRKFPGAPYYLLHTFSHLLMTAISLDCGYPAPSLRERIYVLPAEGTLPDRYGNRRPFGE